LNTSIQYQRFYKEFFHFIILIVAISLAYANSIESSWHFDDNGNIIDNEKLHVNSLSWDELSQSIYSPLSEKKKIARPIPMLSFALNYYYNGLDPVGFHIVNIIIHIITALIVYLVLIHTLRIIEFTEKIRLVTTVSYFDIALLGAFLWALHPIQTQAVTYIVQRMTSMATMFYMAAFYLYLQFRQRRSHLAKIVFMVLAILSWILALGSKENVVLLPLAILGYEIAFFQFDWRKRRVLLKYLIGILVILMCVALWLKGESLYSYLADAYSRRTFTMGERLFLQPVILAKYLFLLFYPISDFLILEPHIVPPKELAEFFIVFVINIGIIVLFFASCYYLRRYPVISFSLFFYFINHIIESTFIPLELYFEHRNYLPSIFIYFAISYYSIKLITFYISKKKLFIKSLIILLISGFLMSEGMATVFRNDIWENEILLHEDTISKSPKSIRPYIAIAVTYMKDDKNFDLALDYLRKIEKFYNESPGEYQPNWVSLIYMNAGSIYKSRKEYDKAIGLFLKSVDINPYDLKVYVNLGTLFFEKSDYENAEISMENAVRLNLNNLVEPYIFYGRVLYEQEKYDLAIEIFRRGLELNPLRDEFRFNIIATYLKQENVTQAKIELSKIPYNDRDIIYLLYRAFLYPGEERDKLLKKIGTILVANNVDYCEWVNSYMKNKYFLIVYPDITLFEPQMRQYYLGAMAELTNEIDMKLSGARECKLDYPAGS
jgi:tetratricopeptide (TPR) repeat protein